MVIGGSCTILFLSKEKESSVNQIESKHRIQALGWAGDHTHVNLHSVVMDTQKGIFVVLHYACVAVLEEEAQSLWIVFLWIKNAHKVGCPLKLLSGDFSIAQLLNLWISLQVCTCMNCDVAKHQNHSLASQTPLLRQRCS